MPLYAVPPLANQLSGNDVRVARFIDFFLCLIQAFTGLVGVALTLFLEVHDVKLAGRGHTCQRHHTFQTNLLGNIAELSPISRRYLARRVSAG